MSQSSKKEVNTTESVHESSCLNGSAMSDVNYEVGPPETLVTSKEVVRQIEVVSDPLGKISDRFCDLIRDMCHKSSLSIYTCKMQKKLQNDDTIRKDLKKFFTNLNEGGVLLKLILMTQVQYLMTQAPNTVGSPVLSNIPCMNFLEKIKKTWKT